MSQSVILFPQTSRDQTAAQFNSVRRIHSQERCRCTPDGRQADDTGRANLEMLSPSVLSRMKQARHFACFRVETGQVGSLMEIAPVTGQCQILGQMLPTVLSGGNMFDVERRYTLEFLMQPAIFASVASAILHQPAQSRSHQDALRLASQTRALA
jgi:hypothetical protein